jgi:hypothetical protein
VQRAIAADIAAAEKTGTEPLIPHPIESVAWLVLILVFPPVGGYLLLFIVVPWLYHGFEPR